MTSLRRYCFIAVYFVTWFTSCEMSSISIVVPGHRQDCLYMEKHAGERLVVDVQVTQGKKIGLRLIGPRKEIILNHENVDSMDVNEKVSIPGEYGFCFLNTNSYMEAVTVHFEYDLHLDDDQGSKFEKQIQNEKNNFIKKQMDKMRPSNPLADSAHKHALRGIEVEDDYPSNDTLAALEHTLLMLSLNMDRMEYFVNKKIAKMKYSHFIQTENLDRVTFFSASICFLIVFISVSQVAVLKSFFNGKLSFKVWQF